LGKDPSSSGLDYVFTYTATGDESEDLSGIGLTVDLVDAAGNSSTAFPLGSAIFDFTPPALAGEPLVSPLVAKNGTLVSVSFEANEDLGAEPVVTLGGVAMSRGDSAGRNYSFNHIAPDTEAEGDHVLSISLSDKAGNPSGGIAGPTVRFDFTPPSISEPDVTPPRAGKDRQVTVTFTVNEPLKTNPVVKTGSVVFSKVGEPRSLTRRVGQVLPSPASGVEYVYSYTLNGTEDQSALTVTVDLDDEAGNASTGLVAGSFVPDFVNPSLVGTPVINKAFAKAGDEVTVTFSASEPLSTDPTVVAGGIVFAKKAQTGNAYDFSYTLAGGETQGAAGIVIDLTDEALNSTVGLPGGSFTIDFSPPGLGAEPTLNPPVAKKGQLVTLDFDASEELGDFPVVTLGGKAMNRQGQSGVHYTYNLIAAESDGEGIKDISITLVDKAGNPSGAIACPSVLFDFSLPGATVTKLKNGPYRSPKAGEPDVEVHVKFTTAEDLDPAAGQVKAVIGGQWPATCPNGPAKAFDCVFKVPAGLQPNDALEGVKAVTLELTDAAGNAATLNAGLVTFDFTPPTFSSSAAPNPAGLGKVLTYTVNAAEPLSLDPLLYLTPAVSLSGPSKSGTLYTWTRTIDGSEAQGAYTVTVDVTDLAGNPTSGLAGTEFSIDRTAPAITTGPTPNKSPAYYKVGDTVSVTFTTNEDLDQSLPTATLNTSTALSMPCAAGGGANDYVCTASRALLATDLPQGQVGVSISLVDTAQNIGFGSATATLDYDNPSLLSAEPSKTHLRAGEVLVYTVNVSEPLGGSGQPTIRVYNDGAIQPGFFGTPNGTNTSFTFTKTVEGGSDGMYTVEIDLADKAGNAVTSTGTPGWWKIDTIVPAVTPVSVTTDNPNFNSLAKEGNEVTCSFETSEELGSPPAVTLHGQQMTFDSQAGAGPWTYVFKRLAIPYDGDGVKVCTVTASDLAGNVSVRDIGAVTFDFTAPAVVGTVRKFLYPPSDCLLDFLFAADAGDRSSVELRVTASEELLGGKPIHVKLVNPELEIVLLHAYTQGLAHTYYYMMSLLPGPLPQGAYALEVRLADLAGNEQTVTPEMQPPGFNVDSVAPTAPDVDSPDKIVYQRIPWGRDSTNGVKTFKLVSMANAVDADTKNVLAFDGGDIATASIIGNKNVAAGTFGEMELVRSDRVVVFVASYDGACNHSPAVKVRDVEWTATMGYKVPGSSVENPHLYTENPVFEESLFQTHFGVTEPSVDDMTRLFALDSNALPVFGEAGWLQRNVLGTGPIQRAFHAMAFNSATGKTLLFGGNNGTRFGDTWEWDGSSWKLLSTEGPSQRYFTNMVYDSWRDRMILFGGFDGSGDCDFGGQSNCGGTWEWDGRVWTLVQTSGPSPRQNHGMAFDSDRGRVVLFGGTESGPVYNSETWEWNGSGWIPVTSVGPAPRGLHAMTYDSTRKKVVLHGGSVGGTPAGDTWEWDGENWQQVSVSGPLPRYYHSMTYDSSRDRVVLFGGYDGWYDGETWEWDGSSWTIKAASGPLARTGHKMVYDSSRGEVVLFGGYTLAGTCDGTGTNYCGGTWKWNGSVWSQETTTKPSSRYAHAMAYDSDREKTVLFGGTDGAYDGETWEWNGTNWTWVSTTGPSPRYYHATTYDSGRGRLVLFGGYDSGGRDGETWEWDGSAWALVGTTGPSARYQHALAYDSGRGRVVLFGGNDAGGRNGETWEWDGAGWTLVAATGPSPRYRHALAYDSDRGRVVLFGGSSAGGRVGDTWEWDGSTWGLISTDGPSPRYGHVLLYDTTRRKTLLFGGNDGNLNDETWEWNGSFWSWSSMRGWASPSPRYDHSAAYDSIRGKVVLFGGWDGSYDNETWESDSGVSSRPGQVMHVYLQSSGCPADAETQSLSAQFYAGGSGFPGGVETNGVDLLAWAGGHWEVVATNTDPAVNPNIVGWATADSDVVRRLIFGAGRTISFAVTSSAPNGTAWGEIDVNYGEVVVKYRQ
jgi:hypothetical protein